MLTEDEKKEIQDQKAKELREQIIKQAKEDFHKGISNPPGKGYLERATLGFITFGLGAIQDKEVSEARELYLAVQAELRR